MDKDKEMNTETVKDMRMETDMNMDNLRLVYIKNKEQCKC